MDVCTVLLIDHANEPTGTKLIVNNLNIILNKFLFFCLLVVAAKITFKNMLLLRLVATSKHCNRNILTLQSLHRAQILAEVVGGERGLLLSDPVLGLVHVAVEALHLVGRAQLRRALRRQLLQGRPFRVQFLII